MTSINWSPQIHTPSVSNGGEGSSSPPQSASPEQGQPQITPGQGFPASAAGSSAAAGGAPASAGPTGPNRLGKDELPVPPQAVLPRNSPGGGQYSYQVADVQGNRGGSLYRQDSATGGWEKVNLPSSDATHQFNQYKLETDRNGGQFVTQTNFNQDDGTVKRAFVPGPFTPSAPPGNQAGPAESADGPQSVSKGPSYVAPPEYQLPRTGPNGEQFTYSVVGDHVQSELKREDQNGNSELATLPPRGDYSVRTDDAGNQYLDRSMIDPGFNPPPGNMGPQKISTLQFRPGS